VKFNLLQNAQRRAGKNANQLAEIISWGFIVILKKDKGAQRTIKMVVE
jgi:hypothetical protein